MKDEVGSKSMGVVTRAPFLRACVGMDTARSTYRKLKRRHPSSHGKRFIPSSKHNLNLHDLYKQLLHPN